jgi:hypothetical protein
VDRSELGEHIHLRISKGENFLRNNVMIYVYMPNLSPNLVSGDRKLQPLSLLFTPHGFLEEFV